MLLSPRLLVAGVGFIYGTVLTTMATEDFSVPPQWAQPPK